MDHVEYQKTIEKLEDEAEAEHIRAQRAEQRAVNAEARVKELERKAEDSAGRIAEQAQFLVDAKARITQLDADLAAAKTVQVHALVADAFVALAEWVDKGASGSRLEQAYGAVRAAGIRLDVVRTYTREEAEAVYAAVYGAPTRTKEKEILVNALMGVPVPPDPRDAVDAPGNFRPVVLFDGAHAAVADAAARGAAELEAQMVERTTPGADEAGGEGAASAHQYADPEDVESLLEQCTREDDWLHMVQAIRLINAKVDTLARKA